MAALAKPITHPYDARPMSEHRGGDDASSIYRRTRRRTRQKSGAQLRPTLDNLFRALRMRAFVSHEVIRLVLAVARAERHDRPIDTWNAMLLEFEATALRLAVEEPKTDVAYRRRRPR